MKKAGFHLETTHQLQFFPSPKPIQSSGRVQLRGLLNTKVTQMYGFYIFNAINKLSDRIISIISRDIICV
jgi:hypothetical protein